MESKIDVMFRNREQKRTFLGWLPLLVFAAVLIGVLTGVAVHRTLGAEDYSDYDAVRKVTTSDFRDYWFTARHYSESGVITDEFGVHNYLPFFTICMRPWAMLPLPVSVGVFTAFSLILLALGVVLVEAVLNQGLSPRPRRATLAAVGLVLAYVVSGATLGAVDTLVVALVLLTWVLFEQRQETAAGVTLGLATLIKVIPGLLVLFFLLRGRWRAAAATAVTCLVLGLGLPLANLGWSETVRLHKEFVERAAVGHSARATIVGDVSNKVNYSNSSLPVTLRRLLTRTNCAKREGAELYVNVVDLPRTAVFYIYAALAILILAASAHYTFHGSRRWPPTETDEISQIRAQFGLWCCVILLLAPLLWTRYLLLAYWPLAFVADFAQRTERHRGRAYAFALVVLVIWLLGVVALGYPPARAAGAQLMPVAALWAFLLWLLWRRPRSASPHADQDRSAHPPPPA